MENNFSARVKIFCSLHGKTQLKNSFLIKLQRLATATLLTIESRIDVLL